MPIDILGTESYTGGAYQKPVARDTGDSNASVIEEFMERMAVHTHTGADSKDISLDEIDKTPELFKSDGSTFTWTLLGNGIYRAILPLTLEKAFTYIDNIRRYFYAPAGTLIDATDWVEFYPSTGYNNATTFYLYSNDNTIDIKIITV